LIYIHFCPLTIELKEVIFQSALGNQSRGQTLKHQHPENDMNGAKSDNQFFILMKI